MELFNKYLPMGLVLAFFTKAMFIGFDMVGLSVIYCPICCISIWTIIRETCFFVRSTKSSG